MNEIDLYHAACGAEAESQKMVRAAMENYQPGDPPPPSHLCTEWLAWAEVQDAAGIKMKRCPNCRRWWYPQDNHNFETCNWSRAI